MLIASLCDAPWDVTNLLGFDVVNTISIAIIGVAASGVMVPILPGYIARPVR